MFHSVTLHHGRGWSNVGRHDCNLPDSLNQPVFLGKRHTIKFQSIVTRDELWQFFQARAPLRRCIISCTNLHRTISIQENAYGTIIQFQLNNYKSFATWVEVVFWNFLRLKLGKLRGTWKEGDVLGRLEENHGRRRALYGCLGLYHKLCVK